jgi:hypothetical protein
MPDAKDFKVQDSKVQDSKVQDSKVQDSKIANVDRLHAYMDRNNLAAVVARSGQNFTYLSPVVCGHKEGWPGARAHRN